MPIKRRRKKALNRWPVSVIPTRVKTPEEIAAETARREVETREYQERLANMQARELEAREQACRQMLKTSWTKEFSSIGEFLRDVAKMVRENRMSSKWHHYNGLSIGQAISLVVKGLPKYTSLVDKLVNECQVDMPGFVRDWHPAVQGPLPNVPAFLAGVPDQMMAYEERQAAGVPMRVFVSVTGTAGFESSDFYSRGCVIAALLQCMATIRPFELFIYEDAGGTQGFQGPLINISSFPLDMATLSAALMHPNFMRQICFGWEDVHNIKYYSLAFNEPSAVGWKLIREVFKAGPNDLVLHSGYHWSNAMSDPVKWIQDMVRESERVAWNQED